MADASFNNINIPSKVSPAASKPAAAKSEEAPAPPPKSAPARQLQSTNSHEVLTAQAQMNRMHLAAQTARSNAPRFNFDGVDVNSLLNSSTIGGLVSGEFIKSERKQVQKSVDQEFQGGRLSNGAKLALTDAVVFNLGNPDDGTLA